MLDTSAMALHGSEELSQSMGMSTHELSCITTNRPSVSSSLLDHDAVNPVSSQVTKGKTLHTHETTSKTRKTTLVIVASYLIAFALAIVHYTMFRQLDGQDTAHVFALRQSQVSAMSLLLVTAFRAAIVATLGVCFTQYLWYVLRRKCLEISLIEDLFQIRSKAWGLFNAKALRQAPILFLVATLSWLVPLATIYPPTALTIQSEMHTTFTSVNATTLNSTMAFANEARLVISGGRIVSMAPLAGENSSYALTFQGPQVQCSNSTPTTSLVSHDHSFYTGSASRFITYNATWPTTTDTLTESVFVPTERKVVGYYPRQLEPSCTRSDCDITLNSRSNDTLTLVLEDRTMHCEAYSTIYRVNISYVRGTQNIEYTTHNATRLGFRWNTSEAFELVADTKKYETWVPKIPLWKVKANECALLDSVGSNPAYQWETPYYKSYMNKTTKYLLPNGTTLELGDAEAGSLDFASIQDILQDSALNTVRFDPETSGRLEPHTDLNITEASINDLLANVTISALSLNTWYENVNVSDSVFRNVYRFSHPSNLFIPYALCLGLTLIFILVALDALRQNGVSATDGGFLQIMMATSGDTKMRREVKEGTLGGCCNASKELLELKVRFGELVTENAGTDSKTYGFGTLEETVSLRRRKRKCFVMKGSYLTDRWVARLMYECLCVRFHHFVPNFSVNVVAGRIPRTQIQ